MKLHQLLFYLLVLLLPTQLGRHFWPSWALIDGIRIDYLSPTVYLTDILVLGVLLSWGWQERKKKNRRLPLAASFLSGFLIINSLLAANPAVAFYKLIKIIEFFLLGLYITKTRIWAHQYRNLVTLLAVGIVYSSLLAIFQFLAQGSLGGAFWFLGERTFSSGTPSIAQAVIDGRLTLRPYATFPHPNVLAGFLVVTMPLLLWLKPRLRLLPLSLGTVALFLTFSRSAWLVFGLTLLVYGLWFLKKNLRQLLSSWPRLVGLVVLVFLASILFSSVTKSFRGLTRIEKESVGLRQDLNSAAVKMIKISPLFGVGLGNFLVRLPEFYQEKGQVRFLQPAHNLYLMIAAETGFLGLGLFFWFTYRTLKRIAHQPILLFALLSLLVLGLFDHYFYTLQQGQLLATFLLALAWSKINLL